MKPNYICDTSNRKQSSVYNVMGQYVDHDICPRPKASLPKVCLGTLNGTFLTSRGAVSSKALSPLFLPSILKVKQYIEFKLIS